MASTAQTAAPKKERAEPEGKDPRAGPVRAWLGRGGHLSVLASALVATLRRPRSKDQVERMSMGLRKDRRQAARHKVAMPDS